MQIATSHTPSQLQTLSRLATRAEQISPTRPKPEQPDRKRRQRVGFKRVAGKQIEFISLIRVQVGGCGCGFFNPTIPSPTDQITQVLFC
jgi:hypothetical protein